MVYQELGSLIHSAPGGLFSSEGRDDLPAPTLVNDTPPLTIVYAGRKKEDKAFPLISSFITSGVSGGSTERVAIQAEPIGRGNEGGRRILPRQDVIFQRFLPKNPLHSLRSGINTGIGLQVSNIHHRSAIEGLAQRPGVDGMRPTLVTMSKLPENNVAVRRLVTKR